MKALLEAEAIAQESDRIFRLGNRTGLGEGEGESNEDSPTPESNAALEIENADSHTNSTMNSTIEADARDRGKKEEEEEEEDIHGFGPRDDSPRILDVSEAKSIISMHVGGAGVKSFDFDKVFPSTSIKFYQILGKDGTLALHGYNVFLAYGQTGLENIQFFCRSPLLETTLPSLPHTAPIPIAEYVYACVQTLSRPRNSWPRRR